MKPSTLVIIAVVLLIPVIAFFATRDSSTNSSPVTTPTPSPSATGYTAPADAVSATKVVLKTDKGNITIDLFPDVAPLAVKNFVTLGKSGYYTNTFFHRIMKDFMIQGGDPTGTGSGGSSIYGTGFKTETNSAKQFHKGTLGMARTSDPNSNGSQFFIVTATDQPSLNNQYTVFGQVDDDASMAVVTAIASVPTTTNPNTGENSVPSVQVHVTGFDIIQ